MAHILLENISIDIPIFNAGNRSLKNRLLQAATGGKISKNEQGRVSVKVLDNISFELKDGDRVALIGHNGAGKSTMLRLLSGVYHPTSGTAAIKGETGSLIDISLGIDPEATGRQNIFIRGALLGIDKQKIQNHLEEIISFTELGEFIDMPLRTYSSGMHLRLAFTVSTIMRPEILLMDEWLSVGDENFQKKAEDRLNDLVRATNILVLATHSRELIQRTCNRVFWLEHGRIKMAGSPDELLPVYFAN
jgi:lipopolysaccharide transport system ATP-binding protein